MLFNSFEFLIFFPIVTLLFFVVPQKLRWLHLLIASCIFYAAFIPSYLLILFGLILVDFLAGIQIERSSNKKTWLVLSIVANIGILSVFKYYNFFIANLNELTGSQLSILHIALPVGLSFHTFQSMSYTIEVYKGRQTAIRHLGYYSLYVMFYPQLVAGPIERPNNLFPQLFAQHKFSSQHLYEGLRLMAWGFFKKTVIADRIGNYVDTVYLYPADMNAGNIWTAIIFFSIQIYADFSGYSDIALGAARCMGFELMINFNRPYQSKNIREFWQRWHISLSTWFKDYVYIPLGGNRKSPLRKFMNTMTTFVLSGFWHGAGWTFIAWGFIHGVYMSVHELLSKKSNTTSRFPIVQVLVTFMLVSFALIFFRAPSIHRAADVIQQAFRIENITLQSITSLKQSTMQYGNFSFLFCIISIIYMFTVEKLTTPLLTNLNRLSLIDTIFFSMTVVGIIFYGVFHKTSFIYFQF